MKFFDPIYPVQIPINSGDTTPVPTGGAGCIIWSSASNLPMKWNGAIWRDISPQVCNHSGAINYLGYHEVIDTVTASGTTTTVVLVSGAIFASVYVPKVYNATTHTDVVITSFNGTTLVFPSVNGDVYNYHIVGY